jgi:hypothetical protein
VQSFSLQSSSRPSISTDCRRITVSIGDENFKLSVFGITIGTNVTTPLDTANKNYFAWIKTGFFSLAAGKSLGRQGVGTAVK